MKFNPIKKIILFGGAPLLLETVHYLKTTDIAFKIYTSERHELEPMDASGITLGQSLDKLNVSYVVTEDINTESTIRDEINKNTLGLGMGEAWSFNADLIERFNGQLLDFMGIPHPRYRGGAHYTWMILRGDKNCGCNLQIINEDMVQGKFDSGDIIKSKRYAFPEDVRTPMDYFNAAVKEEVAFIAEFIDEVIAGKNFDAQAPDESHSLYLPRLNTIAQAFIDWSWSGVDIERFICAFDDPYKGASTWLGKKRIHLKHAKLVHDEGPFHPFQSGLITRIYNNELFVATREGHLKISCVVDEDGHNILDEISIGQRLITPQEKLTDALLFSPDYSATIANQPLEQKCLSDDDFIEGEKLKLRLLTLTDCQPYYLDWLLNPIINQYLETRWHKQDLEAIKAFVSDMHHSANNYLFAIIEKDSGKHIGNIKLGPINPFHQYADVSYFIGEKSAWGKGYATEAIALTTQFGFDKLELNSIQAGVYENNIGSIKALEKVGFKQCGRIEGQLQANNQREAHLWFNLLRA